MPEERMAGMERTRSNQMAQRRYEIVEDVLRANIAAGRLPAGLVLLEGPIADRLQTSRAPVQRALQRLESDGLIHRFEGRGYLVGPADSPAPPLRTDFKAIDITVAQEVDEALQSRGSWERIYDVVESDVAGCVVFGQYRIIETELAGHFNVSRTVVRDVLSRLQERGLVRKNQSSHWMAGPLTAQSIKDHYALRRLLEPPALVSAARHIDHEHLKDALARLMAAEADPPRRGDDTAETLETLLVDICVLATPNEKLRDLIRNNLLPVAAAERLLRQLGLPGDHAAITEQRLVVELMLRGAHEAAAAMMDAHLDATMNRNIAQMKIVAVIPRPQTIPAYLTAIS